MCLVTQWWWWLLAPSVSGLSDPVFPTHSYLGSPKADSSTSSDHGMKFISNLGPLSCGPESALLSSTYIGSAWHWPHLIHGQTVYPTSFHLVPFCPTLQTYIGNKILTWTIACLGVFLTPHPLLIFESWMILKNSLTMKLSGPTMDSHTRNLVLTAVWFIATGLEHLHLP